MIEKVNDNMKHRTTRFLFSSVICLSLLGVVIFIWLGSVMALARRKAAGLPAFTVMSCDNMPENGHVMRDVVTSYAKAVDVKLAQ